MLYESLVVFAIAFLASLAFYGASHGRLSGGTRLLFQLRDDSLSVEVGRAALRYALAWPSLLVFGVGFLWAFVDRDRQFLHDRLAGTRIVMSDDARARAKDP